MVEEADTGRIKRLSAELNGVLTYYGGAPEPASGGADLHVLITSDTYLGQRVGEIIELWLRSRGLAVDVWRPSGLVTNDRDSFREAMATLIHRCEDVLTDYRNSGYRIAFNLTGGFKSAQGFLQTIGMFYADEIFYIFETGSLLSIPRLPIKLDTEGVIGEHDKAFRRLGLGEVLSAEECEGIPETLLFQAGQEATLSEWGTLVWKRGKKQLYGKRLINPLSGLRYAPHFKRKVERLNLTAERLARLNERLDELSLVVRKKRSNLRGLNFKKLKGDPRPPSTHECDIWSDDERRLFGHYEEGAFVIDDIERGLH
ncbi:MAG: putative CRISPR-associated protein [Actinomycetota bacterium]